MAEYNGTTVKRTDPPTLEEMDVDGYFALVEEDNDWGWIAAKNPMISEP